MHRIRLAVALVACTLVIAPLHAVPADAAEAGVALELAHDAAAAGPTMGEIINTRGRAIAATEFAATGATVGTSSANIMAAVADVAFDADTVQNFRVVNTHASQAICVKDVARSSSAQSCNTACTSLTLTCTGSGANDGLLVQASGPPQPIPLVGTDCLCVVGSASSSTYNVTRVARAPNA